LIPIDLTGFGALICASSRGLGYAVAEVFVQAGADVIISGRDPENLSKAQNSLRTMSKKSERHQKIEAIALDLTKSDSSARLWEESLRLLDKVDILVNNVGGPPPSSARETTLEGWQSGFERLFLSAVLLTQKAVKPMCERRFGRVLTITSLSVAEPIEHLVVSTAMRQAVTGFMKTLSTEVARDGVTVNTVMPGVIHTHRIEELRRAKAEREGSRFEDEMAKSAALIPVGRLGQPAELAHLVAFLASPLGSYITGAHIPVDGGLRRGW
jgi:3-oxoacyl-[acyl-carrier protein] reductase